MARPIFIQMGLFGGQNEIAGTHVVQAHTRVRADGSEVFVGEHVRWNRGRTHTIPKVRTNREVPDDHPSLPLKGGLPGSPSSPPLPSPCNSAAASWVAEPVLEADDVPTDPMPVGCPFGMPGATQLHFWEER